MKPRALPTTMKALVRTAAGVDLVERALPSPARGQVLVQMRAAPINPNDLMVLVDNYDVPKPVGAILGFEGAGRVVAVGGGAIARFMLGRDVACAAGSEHGTWAEYAVIDAMKCAPLDRTTDPLQGAMLFTNPMTASVLLETGRRGGHRAFVQNAAAGAIGKMLVRLCASARLPLLNIVRRREQADALHAIGAEHVVIAGTDDLRAACEKLRVTCAFDAIGGTATGDLASAIAVGGTIHTYGMLSGQPVTVDTNTLVFRRIQIRGFTMYAWLENTSLLGKLRTVRGAQKRLAKELRSEIRSTHPLADHARALELARGGTSDGKLLFVSASP